MMRFNLTLAAMLAAALWASPAAAQPGPGGGWGGWGPGMMMGPGMMGPGGMGRFMCDPRAAGLAEWRMQAIERAVQPTDAQRTALDELRKASTKAAEIVAAACPREFPTTASARMEAMEKRLDSMLQAIKAVRPAFDSFYSSLNDEQKKRVDAVGPRRWGWRGWRQSERGD
jgi:LTXXQ motif family protein